MQEYEETIQRLREAAALQQQATPGPWEIDPTDEASLVAGDGFELLSVADTARLLPQWSTTGARHWSDRPGETYVRADEERPYATAAFIAACGSLDLADVLRLLDTTQQTNQELAAENLRLRQQAGARKEVARG